MRLLNAFSFIHPFKLSALIRDFSQVVFDISIVGTLGANSLIMILGVIGGILMARALGPEGRGQVAAVLVSAQFLSWVFNFGLGWGNLYYINKEPTEVSAILTNSLVFTALVTIPTLVIGGYLVIYWFVDYPQEVKLAAGFFLALVPLSIVTDYLILAQQALQEFRWFNTLRIGRQLAQLIGMVILFFGKSLTPSSSILMIGAANLMVGLLAIGWFQHHYWNGLKLKRNLLGRCLSFGLKAYFGSLAQTSNRRLDQMLMVLLVNVSDLGLYSVAASLSGAVGVIPNSVATVVSPRVAHASKSDGKRLLRQNFWISCFIVSILVAVPILGAETILQALYGNAFTPAVAVFRILLLASLFLGVGDLLLHGLNGLGRPAQGTAGEALALITNIPLILFLVPIFGIVGAAIASLIAYCLRVIFLLSFVTTTKTLETKASAPSHIEESIPRN